MSRREDVALARGSSDLGELVDGHNPVDVIRAIGLVGQRYSVALEVWRLVDGGERRALHPAFNGLLAVCPRLGIVSNPYHVVSRVLLYMCDPKCVTCGGRGQLFDRLVPADCQDCEASGVRPSGWGPNEMALDDWITQEQNRAAAAISRKLRDE